MDYDSLDEIKSMLKTSYSLASCCQIYGITEEAQVAESAIWPNPFLINMFTALKGYQFHFYYLEICSPLTATLEASRFGRLETDSYRAFHWTTASFEKRILVIIPGCVQLSKCHRMVVCRDMLQTDGTRHCVKLN